MHKVPKILLLAACWLAMGFGCGREPQPCTEEVGTPIPVEEELTANLRANCMILNQERPSDFDKLPIAVTEYVINNQAEYERWIGPRLQAPLPNIDFSRYTLIAGQKLIGQGRFSDQSLDWRCNSIYYQLKIYPFGVATIGLADYFAVIPKLPFKPRVEYVIVR